MRPKNKIVDPNRAFELHQKISEREELRRALFLDNIKDLSELHDTQGYKAILGGSDDHKWTGYLGLVEVFYSRSQIDKWRKLYQVFINEIGFTREEMMKNLDIPYQRLLDVANIIRTKEDAYEWLSKARTISGSRDWNDELCEAQGNPTSLECEHKMQTVEVCKKCGVKHEI